MVEKFLSYLRYERNYSELTIVAYQNDLSEFAEFLGVSIEEMDPKLVSEDDIKSWMISMLDAGITPRSARRKLSALRTFWKFLLKIRYLEVDVTSRIVLPKITKPLPEFYKEKEMQKMQIAEQYADDFVSIRDNLVIELLYETGMRRAELVSLKDKDIDFVSAQLKVFGKRKKERIIPLGEKILTRIQQYIACRDLTFGQQPADESLIVSNKGTGITASNVYKIVHERMSEYSTLHKQSPHVLRHTFATTMLNNGADINTIKTLLGHSSLASTEVYTHTTFEQVKKAYQQAHPRAKKQ